MALRLGWATCPKFVIDDISLHYTGSSGQLS